MLVLIIYLIEKLGLIIYIIIDKMDFNNETTVGIPAADVERISILQRRYDMIEALEDYKKKRLNGVGVTLSIVRARLFSLFVEIQALLKRRLSEIEYNNILNSCLNDTKEDELIKTIFLLNEQLDEIKLTRIDTSRVYDSLNVEEENKEKGF